MNYLYNRKVFCSVISLLVLLTPIFSISACSTVPKDSRIANVGGHPVAYRVLGAGTPVLVMVAGLGDGMASFKDIAPELAKSATVIVYDRAGYGGSEPISGPKDAKMAEAELESVLSQSGVAGPYVLVGHSLGGLFAEYFAAKHPDQIAGLILEESRPANFTHLCKVAGISMCAPTPAMAKLMPLGAKAEVDALDATTAEVEFVEVVTGKPVLILSRPIEKDAKPFDALWSKAQRNLAQRYPGSLHLIAASGGHYIHRDQSAWYAEVIVSFLKRVSQSEVKS